MPTARVILATMHLRVVYLGTSPVYLIVEALVKVITCLIGWGM
jgi:hypothetical protein